MIADDLALAAFPYLADELISPTNRDDLSKVAGFLPRVLSNFFGFECVLGEERTATDFLVCCKAHDGGLARLAGDPTHPLPDILLRQPAWQRVQATAAACVRSGSELFGSIHNLWLEFDVNGAVTPPYLVPNVFVGSYQLRSDGFSENSSDSEAKCVWLTKAALPMLAGRHMAPEVCQQIAKCLGALPPGAWLFQVGLMLARDAPTTRLCARGLAPEQIVQFLERVSWPGARQRLEELLDYLARIVDRFDLDLDVAATVQPKIGLECYLHRDGGDMTPLLNYLMSANLCTKPKAEALRRWPGIVRDFSPETFVRRVHHLKLDLEAAAPIRAKAYLGVHCKRTGRPSTEGGQEGGMHPT